MTVNPSAISRSMLTTYWRSRLYRLLRQSNLITAIVLGNTGLQFETISWDDYWGKVPGACRTALNRLEQAWRGYITSGFSSDYAKPYGTAILKLLKIAIEEMDSGKHHRTFLSCILSFENTALRRTGKNMPFAAVTTTFRNPFLATAPGIILFGALRKTA